MSLIKKVNLEVKAMVKMKIKVEVKMKPQVQLEVKAPLSIAGPLKGILVATPPRKRTSQNPRDMKKESIAARPDFTARLP